MAIEQLPDGRWKVDVEPIKGKRFRKTVRTKAEALRFEATCRTKLVNTPGWSPRPKDRRRLLDLLKVWERLHGQTLASYYDTEVALRTMFDRMGNPVASSLTSRDFVHYRSDRLRDGLSKKTVNNELAYLRSFFNRLIEYQEIEFPNPVSDLKLLPVQETELTYLDQAEIDRLFAALRSMQHPHVELVATVCLATGCRWGEAQGLLASRVRGGMVQFVGTKGRRRRSVPIPDNLERRLLDHLKRHGAFSSCRDRFDEALAKSEITLPKGQKTHVLRHTFASHFVMNGGNLRSLQLILGHTTLAMTMRYAHLAPDHMADALRLGPMRDFRHFIDSLDAIGQDEGEKSL